MKPKGEKFLSVGEFAELCHTNVQTLQYYDKIGLLKPAKTDSCGRRYYRALDITLMWTIQAYQECGATLKEIDAILHMESDVEKLAIMREKRDEYAQKLHQMQLTLDRLDNALSFLDSMTSNLTQNPTVVHYDEEMEFHAIEIDGGAVLGSDKFVHSLHLLMKNDKVPSSIQYPLNIVFDYDSLLHGKLIVTHILSTQDDAPGTYRRKLGDVMLYRFNGTIDSTPSCIRDIMSFLRREKLTICADPIANLIVFGLNKENKVLYSAIVALPVKSSSQA